MSRSTWFPRPESPSNIIAPVQVGSERGLLHSQLFALLTDASAKEWRHKTGVPVSLDGSAKTTRRLLLSRGWVFKTGETESYPDLDKAAVTLSESVSLASRLGLWHPSKHWFILRSQGRYWNCSATPYVKTLRRLVHWKDKYRWWGEMLRLSTAMLLTHQVVLDVSPSNFGFEDDKESLFYIDDEVYSRGDLRDIGEAIVPRLLEEPTITENQWYALGKHLRHILASLIKGYRQWQLFLDGVRNYPLTPSFSKQRRALMAGLSTRPPTRLADVGQATRICLLADVHGNLPALEALLKEAKALGADYFIALGDIVGYGPHPKECIQRIANMPNVLLVRGNHDNTVGTGVPEDGSSRVAALTDVWTREQLNPDERAWLEAMPVEHVFDTWMVVHGAPRCPHRFYGYVYEMTYKENLRLVRAQRLKIAFYGHTHVPFIHLLLEEDGTCTKLRPQPIELFQPGKILLVNPGSVGQPRDGDSRAAFAIWDKADNTLRFHRVSYPVENTVKAIRGSGLPENVIYKLISNLEVGR